MKHETILEWNDKDIEHYHARRMAMDSMLCRFKDNNKRQGELDFIIEQNGVVLPLEVKSGKDYERHKALSNVVNSHTYQISQAYVLCNDNVKKVGKITYLPIYMLMFIKKEQKLPTKYAIDLSGLV